MLKKAKVQEIQELTQMLISKVDDLATKEDAPRKEVLDLSNELDAFKKQASEFNKVSLVEADDQLRKKSAEDLATAFGPFEERALKFKAIALAES